jgi:pyridoxal phosphate enzyme (YggS family)
MGSLLMNIINNLEIVKDNLVSLKSKAKIIVVCKNQQFSKIQNLLDFGHLDFGENKIQEAHEKWNDLLKNNNNINLHFIGSLQSNKAKQAFQIFNYVHSLDSEKLAKIFHELEVINRRQIKYFVQVNIGSEPQKNGIDISVVNDFVNYCKHKLNLNIIGLMAIPPKDQNPELFFKQLYELNLANNLEELSMGMSDDYKIAAKYNATYVRIGSAIFS